MQAGALGVFMRSHPKFRGWSAQTLQRFEDAGTRIALPAGAVIHHSGMPAADVCILTEGVVETLTALSSGEEHSTAFWHPGVILGMPAVFMPAGSRRRQTWTAHTDVTFWRVQLDAVRTSFWEDRVMAEAVVAGLGRRIVWLTEELAHATLLPAECKVLAKLLMLNDLEGVAGDGPMHPLRMTQGKLAEILGLTRQSVGRVLKDLENRGLVKIGRFSIDLQSIEGLRAYALECGAARLPP